MDLYLDKDAFEKGSQTLEQKKTELQDLRQKIEQNFAQLKQDWKSDAGTVFFQRFENDLLGNLDAHITVLEYMHRNLSTASQKYDEVFRDADAVASAQY